MLRPLWTWKDGACKKKTLGGNGCGLFLAVCVSAGKFSTPSFIIIKAPEIASSSDGCDRFTSEDCQIEPIDNSTRNVIIRGSPHRRRLIFLKYCKVMMLGWWRRPSAPSPSDCYTVATIGNPFKSFAASSWKMPSFPFWLSDAALFLHSRRHFAVPLSDTSAGLILSNNVEQMHAPKRWTLAHIHALHGKFFCLQNPPKASSSRSFATSAVE